MLFRSGEIEETRRPSGRSDTEAITDVVGTALREVGGAVRTRFREDAATERERLRTKRELARTSSERDEEDSAA